MTIAGKQKGCVMLTTCSSSSFFYVLFIASLFRACYHAHATYAPLAPRLGAALLDAALSPLHPCYRHPSSLQNPIENEMLLADCKALPVLHQTTPPYRVDASVGSAPSAT